MMCHMRYKIYRIPISGSWLFFFDLFECIIRVSWLKNDISNFIANYYVVRMARNNIHEGISSYIHVRHPWPSQSEVRIIDLILEEAKLGVYVGSERILYFPSHSRRAPDWAQSLEVRSPKRSPIINRVPGETLGRTEVAAVPKWIPCRDPWRISEVTRNMKSSSNLRHQTN
jgi:hypothetical protein